MAYLNLMDMFDGGGAGASGSEFKGGPVSGLLNQLGVRPRGYADRTAGMDQMPPMRPRQTGAPSRGAPAPSPVSTGLLSNPNDAYNRQWAMTEPALPPMQYSGRGYAGMPVQPELQADEYTAALEYLRRLGMVNY